MTDEQDPTAVRFPPVEEGDADHEPDVPPSREDEERRDAGTAQGAAAEAGTGTGGETGTGAGASSGEAAAEEPGETAEGEPAEDGKPREKSAEEELQELRERWQRALADLDNLRKRHARELERERTAERMRTASALLPLLDHLEMALEYAESDPASVVDGVKAVRDEAVGTFEKLGFKRDDQTGVPFDPLRHEAVGTVEDDGAEPGTVKQVLRPGYGDGGTQLRPASVTVTSRQEE